MIINIIPLFYSTIGPNYLSYLLTMPVQLKKSKFNKNFSQNAKLDVKNKKR